MVAIIQAFLLDDFYNLANLAEIERYGYLIGGHRLISPCPVLHTEHLNILDEALRHRPADSYYLYRIRLLKIMGRDQEAMCSLSSGS